MEKTCVVAAGLYCALGMEIPIAPTGAAVLAVVMVRILLWSKNQSILWNAIVCLLCSLAAIVTIEGSDLSTFFAFWLGVGYGALGVSIIELGKKFTTGDLRNRIKQASDILLKDDKKQE